MTSISQKLESYQDEKVEFQEEKTCYISKAKQHSKLWYRLRTGAITMSTISSYLGRSPWSIDPKTAAKYICGLEEPVFTPEAKARMQIGTDGEPYVRAWYESFLQSEFKNPELRIREVGISIWKPNPIFRGSLDGDVDFGSTLEVTQRISAGLTIEIKIPKRLYQSLIDYLEACKRNGSGPSAEQGGRYYHDHIYNSHYDQMMGNGVIRGKDYVDYVVCPSEGTMSYIQRLPVNHDHWNRILYPAAIKFYQEQVEPVMRAHSLYRIDP